MNVAKAEPIRKSAPPPSLGDYYSAAQLRNDQWTDLKAAAQALAAKGVEPAHSETERVRALLDALAPIESYWAFPGLRGIEHLRRDLSADNRRELAETAARVARALLSGAYRRKAIAIDAEPEAGSEEEAPETQDDKAQARPYFEVLIVDALTPAEEEIQRQALHEMRRADDRFVYEPVFVPSFEDALIAVLFNHNIQSVVVRFDFRLESANDLPILQRYLARAGGRAVADLDRETLGPELCRALRKLRPELDVFLVTDRSVEDLAGSDLGGCLRVFYNTEDYVELHLNILRGVEARYETPFFNALKEYSKRPTGVFHAMPISRGKSIARSHWIRDMGDFYGMNIFLAETSATSGGLDSLLEPHGPIKKAQALAARAFGAKQSFFATNGTSTCNKIVVQAILRPGDIVLLDRDCHKSHHYGMVLAGAEVAYLESYPLGPYSMYGAVPLRAVKEKLLAFEAAGKLDRVRMVLLTNCTFDGIVYNVERVMEECLAIKPDLVFLWDEAWFGFARFGPTYRQRTAMHAAETLRERFRSPAYRARYAAQARELAGADRAQRLAAQLLPDPDRARIRVYATQSTHKTLTALRQGSMIHVWDQDFKGEVEQAFHEAYMTHTSTSPNYQIIASLDVGRRQVELEGFELVQKQVEAAMAMRKAIASHPLLKKYFRVLTVADMIPASYRQSGIESYWDQDRGGWNEIWEAWTRDEFALDATRITLAVGGAGYDGNSFKNAVLMDRYGIQINKTSRNTVLFMTNIGTTRSSVAYLIEVLVKIAQEIETELEDGGPRERRGFAAKVKSLVEDVPPLPDFSRFHPAFRAKSTAADGPDTGSPDTGEGNLRAAYFLAYDESACDYLALGDGTLDAAIARGEDVVSTSFVIPYPPGFPILVPGQIVTPEIVAFMKALDVKEIHGYRPELGLRVFTPEALARQAKRAVIAD